MDNNDEILSYQNSEGNIRIDMHLENETVWLTQNQMATLFGKGKIAIKNLSKMYLQKVN